MKLIGMSDSPFVRRVAISAKRLGLSFEHEQISVMRQFEAFSAYNPLVKAPTLITDDGTVLMESTVILEYLEKRAGPDKTLFPEALSDFVKGQRVIGLALIACEKTVQIVYEYNMRPADKMHPEWLTRVETQLGEAYSALDKELEGLTAFLGGDEPTQADITAACAWGFTRLVYPNLADPSKYPAIAALSKQAETLPEFISTPLV